MNRPIVIAIISYMFGILLRLYTNCIVLIFLKIVLIIIFILSLKINNKYFRFIKMRMKIVVLIIVFVFLNFGYFYTNIIEDKYESFYNNLKSIESYGIIVEEPKEKEYSKMAKVKILEENVSVYIYTNKNVKYGDLIYFSGKYEIPEIARNEYGFNYRNYLKTLKVIGTVKDAEVEIIQEEKINVTFNKLKNYLKENVRKILKNDEYSNLVIAMVLGDTEGLSEELEKNFNDSNLTHILAVSGTQVSSIILSITIIFTTLKMHKRLINIISIIVLLIFMFITKFSPSVQRACIVGILNLIASVLFRRADIWNNLAISLFVILINNPYCIWSLSLILSYLGFLGIIAYSNFEIKVKNRFLNYIIYNTLVITIIQLFIFPVILYNFGIISFTFLFSNIIVVPIASVITICGFIIMIFPIKIFRILNFFIYITIKLTSFFASLSLSKIYVIIPNLIFILIYYLILFYLWYLREKGYMHRVKHFFKKQKNKIIFILILLIFINVFYKPNEFKLNFINVGQGDSTLITTESNKKVLIDGGGSEFNSSFDVGEKTLLPYLLKHHVSKLDYIIISHFDSDHVGGLFKILEKLKVEKIIIGKQFENSENYQKFIKITKEKNIKIKVVKAGDKIYLDKNTYINVIWPDINNIVNENMVNNNSLVFKMVYKKFSILFTGDIEEIAERRILNLYGDRLKADILKIAHHGSKTSSIEEFIKAVSPRIALIGVGKDNNFGRPNEEVIQRLKNYNIKIYRTDFNGEIDLKIDKKITIRKLIEN